jgi:hypothetical protein
LQEAVLTDTHTQLTILADALTSVIDLADDGAMPAHDFVEKVADLAATALMAASTYGPLPPPSRPADLAARAGEALRRTNPERWPA